jgi:hypothetical protein
MSSGVARGMKAFDLDLFFLAYVENLAILNREVTRWDVVMLSSDDLDALKVLNHFGVAI